MIGFIEKVSEATGIILGDEFSMIGDGNTLLPVGWQKCEQILCDQTVKCIVIGIIYMTYLLECY